MRRLRAGSSRRGILATPRLITLMEILGRLGPLTRGQLLRTVCAFLPDLLDDATRDHPLLRRALARLRMLGFLGEQGRVGLAGPWYWFTAAGETFLLDAGRISEARGDVVTPYFARPVHGRLLADIHLTCDIARHRPDLSPQITRYAWEEHVTWTVPDQILPSRGTDVEPDAVLWLSVDGVPGTVLWAVEADVGTEALTSTWTEKLTRYAAVAEAVANGRFTLPTGVRADSFRVLVVTPSPIRAENLAGVTAEILGDKPPMFLVTTPDRWTESVFWAAAWWAAGGGCSPADGLVSLRSALATAETRS